jgi:hypothetical protein
MLVDIAAERASTSLNRQADLHPPLGDRTICIHFISFDNIETNCGTPTRLSAQIYF